MLVRTADLVVHEMDVSQVKVHAVEIGGWSLQKECPLISLSCKREFPQKKVGVSQQ